MTRAITFKKGQIQCGMKILEMPDPLTKRVDAYYKCECLHCGNIFMAKHNTLLLRDRVGIDHCRNCPEVKLRIKNKQRAFREKKSAYKSHIYYVPEDIQDPVPWAPTDPHGMWPIY